MTKPGIEYEIFVQTLMQAIISADTAGLQNNIAVEHNKILKDRNGVERQFDVYWKYEIGGITYESVIECKDYASAVSIEKIDALLGKLHDFPNIRGILATTNGYQSGAETKAKGNNIDVLVIRKADNREFTAPDGTPLVRKIQMKIQVLSPATIIQFLPQYDFDWILANTSFKKGDRIEISEREDNILIDDISGNRKFSLLDISNSLQWPGNTTTKESGKYSDEVKFDEAYLIVESQGLKLKLKSYKIEYVIYEPTNTEFEIDGADMYAGVVEYLSKGEKKIIGKDGNIKTTIIPESKVDK